ncbi:chromosome partitioning protein ParB [Pseudonocardia sp. DSM 110487]|uniref:chromosome partitioning protein ParB n=1 Tax=Pseudonocardia sp. DSM 110487 TaxID=2865833 RepID=UPI001C6A3E8B|nr:chromosome partitioning protein ParB [Pseudonocardia sp. DSM 110487]QYN36779.1 chromosome partitioning protein ParB [Pseudonocardia sp. DSM 110487]
MADTGFPATDAEHDFLRARRRAVLSRLAAWLRREPDDVSEILPFDEVVAALGRVAERRLGLQVVPLESIVGSVDRTRDFDRWFRPRSGRSRERWERLARAQRRGEAIPPIDVYRVGELHFVKDGHHRVSVAHALGFRTIDAFVTEVTTRIDATGISRRGDLITKDLRRVFLDRVPLPGPALATILVTTAWSYAELSEEVEAWGFRLMQQERRFLDRETVARRWYAEEYRPVVRMLAQADLIGERTEAEAYLHLAGQRYRLMRTHRWDDEVIEHLRSDPGH